eukprot:2638400-Rhodomonas_salina.1
MLDVPEAVDREFQLWLYPRRKQLGWRRLREVMHFLLNFLLAWKKSGSASRLSWRAMLDGAARTWWRIWGHGYPFWTWNSS